MELQEKAHVPIFTEVNRDVFLRQICPEVRETCFLQRTALFLTAAENVNTVSGNTPQFIMVNGFFFSFF